MDLWELRRQLDEANILICFNGPLSQSIIEQLGVAVKRYLEEEAEAGGRLYDVFAIYIEQTQNIRNYAARKAREPAGGQARYDAATLAIGRTDQGYLVTAGNPVARPDVARLTAEIDELRGLDADALKARYKEQRRKPRDEGSPGAGLGLIDMARKASRPLEYRLQDIDSNTVFFHLIAVI